ncbi:MAG: hypothetical protein LUG99_09470 [Lachnospiraceae bacterium]|nr:hypothetical protein [Lachnospiraceae bacterium]
MRYRIEFTDRRPCKYVQSREELLLWLKNPRNGAVSDIRKVYTNGATDSVFEKYKPLINNPNPCIRERKKCRIR